MIELLQAPTTTRLALSLTEHARHGDRRIWLEPGKWRTGQVNYLVMVVPSARDADHIASLAVGLRLRFGTRARYRQEIAAAKAIHGALGWTLTTDEQRLMKALEDYAAASRQANAA